MSWGSRQIVREEEGNGNTSSGTQEDETGGRTGSKTNKDKQKSGITRGEKTQRNRRTHTATHSPHYTRKHQTLMNRHTNGEDNYRQAGRETDEHTQPHIQLVKHTHTDTNEQTHKGRRQFTDKQTDNLAKVGEISKKSESRRRKGMQGDGWGKWGTNALR